MEVIMTKKKAEIAIVDSPAVDDGGDSSEIVSVALEPEIELEEEEQEVELTLEYLADIVEDFMSKQREFNRNVKLALPHVNIVGGDA
jgi:benzoyl-CoA reductase/2-hydroxyglutaryl-CoA dehydratase subunit BcrC/BadD/HgdB